MGDKDKAQGRDGKTGKAKRHTGGREISVVLEKLTQKIKKCQTRQKDLEKLGKSHQADSLSLARELRRVDRQSTALLAQLKELTAGQRELEQGQTLDRAAAAEIRGSLEGYASRLESDTRQSGEITSRTQRVEQLSQQAIRKTEVLEHRIDSVERALDLYEQQFQACVAIPADALEAVANRGCLQPQEEPALGGRSNVVVFKRLQSGEAGAAGAPSATDREMLLKLQSRLETLEALAARLESNDQASSRTLESLEAGQERLAAREDGLRQWVEQEIEGLSSLGDATRSDLDRQFAEDLQRDAALDALKQTAEQASKLLDLLTNRLDTVEAANAEFDALNLNHNQQLDLLTNRLDTVEAANAEFDALSRNHNQQLDLLTDRLDTVEADNAKLNELNHNQQLDLQDLHLQANVGAEHGRILAAKIGTLDVAWAGLEETAEWQASQLGQLGEETRRLGGDTEALSGQAEGLAARLDETAGQAQVLERRVWELEHGAAALAEQTQRLEGERRRLANAHDRLSGGAAILLLLLIGVIAAFWASRPQQDLGTLWQGEVASLRQTLDRQAARMSAQDQGLADVQSRLARQPEPQAPLGELSTLIEAQSRGLADQQILLADYRQELTGTQGSLAQTGAAVERLAQQQQQLAQELLGLRQQLAGPPQPDRGPALPPSASQQRGQHLRGGDWVAQQQPAHYTIQLVAAHAPRVIDDVAGSFAPTDTLARYRRLHDGRDWHVLLYGSYPSLAQAREAMAGLPEPVRSFGPWIRKFNSVQADLVQP